MKPRTSSAKTLHYCTPAVCGDPHPVSRA
jgi:hypothetical protein